MTNQPNTPGAIPAAAPAAHAPGPSATIPVAPVAPAVPPAGNGAKPTAVKKEPTEKVAKEPKPKKEKDPNAVSRPRLPKYPDEHKITVMKENAKARGAADRFKLYHTGQTVKEYVEKMAAEPWKRTAGQTQADMRWDEDHKFIHVGPDVVPVPPPPAPTAIASPPATGAPAPSPTPPASAPKTVSPAA